MIIIGLLITGEDLLRKGERWKGVFRRFLNDVWRKFLPLQGMNNLLMSCVN